MSRHKSVTVKLYSISAKFTLSEYEAIQRRVIKEGWKPVCKRLPLGTWLSAVALREVGFTKKEETEDV